MKFLPLVLLLSACAAPTRHVSSLDNNGDVHDDSFDPNLESYFGGSAEGEKQANDVVAGVIRDAVAAQQAKRQEVAQSPAAASKEAQRIFRDLPKPDYATRDVHRKTNGCFKADLQFSDDLVRDVNDLFKFQYESDERIANDESLGLFTPGARYDAIVRLSNGNPGNNADNAPDARGFAVKLLPQGTLGDAKIASLNASDLNLATKLDILAINFPTFFVNDPAKYAALNRGALEGSRDFKNSLLGKAEQFKAVFLSSKFTALERRLTFEVNGSVIYSPLFQEYFSMVPSRWGVEGQKRAVKYSWTPVSCRPPETDDRFLKDRVSQWPSWAKDHSYGFPPRSPLETLLYPHDYLRQNATSRLAADDFCFNLYVQFYRDPESTSIEDSTDIWLRNSDERQWWVNREIPGAAEWLTSPDNTESHAEYLARFNRKKYANPVRIARLTIHRLAAGEGFQPVGNNKTCEDLSFNPWNGDIAHHKPLGIISRLKRKVYNASRRERHQLNGVNDQGIERK